MKNKFYNLSYLLYNKRKLRKKIRDIFKLCKEYFSEDINDQNFPEHMNTLVKERKVISMTYSKKESYSLVQTNELSDILTIKEELKNLKAELITFKDSVVANLEMKQNSNERNKIFQPNMNIASDEFVSSQGEYKNFNTVKHFQDESKFYGMKLEIKVKLLKL